MCLCFPYYKVQQQQYSLHNPVTDFLFFLSVRPLAGEGGGGGRDRRRPLSV